MSSKPPTVAPPDDDGTAQAAALSTHLDARGQVRMVDVGAKQHTTRVARASALVRMSAATVQRLRDGATHKGEVLATARIAGIMAAKRTSELIPLCHGVALTRVALELAVTDEGVALEATAEAHDRTGVEMEAMTAATVAALTLYDMLKGTERGITIERVALEEKSGGRSGHWRRER